NERCVAAQMRELAIVASELASEKSAPSADLKFGSRRSRKGRWIRIHGRDSAARLRGLLSAEGHGTSIRAVEKKAGCVCRKYIKKKAARGEDCQPSSTNGSGISGNHGDPSKQSPRLTSVGSISTRL